MARKKPNENPDKLPRPQDEPLNVALAGMKRVMARVGKSNIDETLAGMPIGHIQAALAYVEHAKEVIDEWIPALKKAPGDAS